MLSQKITELNHLPNYQSIVASCKIRALSLFFVQGDEWDDEDTGDQLSADALWSKGKLGKLQVCEDYESWDVESIFRAVEEVYHEFHAFAVELLEPKRLKYGFKKDILLANLALSEEARLVISEYADWIPSDALNDYQGKIFTWETIVKLSNEEFYDEDSMPLYSVLDELKELSDEMYNNDCDTVYIGEVQNEKD